MQNYFDLNKRIIIVTGAGGFLGSEYTKDLLSYGAKIVAIDIDKTKLLKLKKNLNTTNLLTISADITKDKDWKKIVSTTLKKFEKIDVLINNAEINPAFSSRGQKNYKNIFKLSDHEIKNSQDVSIKGSFLGCKYVSKVMIKQKKGNIINVASDLSVIAPNHSLYNESKPYKFTKPIYYSINKHGIIGLTKYLATYLCAYNIRVNAISPGSVKNNQSKEFTKKIKTFIPLGRMAQPDEISSTIIFLASDASSYMTGHNLVIDGGRSIW